MTYKLSSLVLSALLLLSACGKKGDPQPPLRLTPQTTTDLSVVQKGEEFLLALSYPQTTASGFSLGPIKALELWVSRTIVGADGEAPTLDPRAFAGTAEKVLTIQGAELNSAIQGDRLSSRFRLSAEHEDALIFAIRTISREEDESAFSNRVGLGYREAPEAPIFHNLQATEAGVKLSFKASEDTVAVNVFRRLATDKDYGEALVKVESQKGSYLDRTARFGHRYIYTLTALADEEALVESSLATEREVDYRDQFAPAPPADLLALPDGPGVHLSWKPSVDTDVAHYKVWRADPGADFRCITLDGVSDLEIHDRGLVSGFTYRYRVTSVDLRKNEGAPSRVISVTLQ